MTKGKIIIKISANEKGKKLVSLAKDWRKNAPSVEPTRSAIHTETEQTAFIISINKNKTKRK